MRFQSALASCAVIGLSIGVGIMATPTPRAKAGEHPAWAFPATEPTYPALPDDGKPKQVAGSSKSYTLKEIQEPMGAPDWFPDEHPPMPEVVAKGHPGTPVRSCAGCHMPDGQGHPENARLTGTSAYLARQITDFRSGARKWGESMIAIAKGMSDDDIRTSTEYYASLKPKPWTRVVEADTAPRTFVGKGNMRFAYPDGSTEPLGNRIIEVPENAELRTWRDPHSGFVAYVPKGSVAKGQALVTGGGGKTIPCAICHGPTLSGLGDVPDIVGRSPVSIARQLYMIQDGTRGGSSAALMKAVVDKLNDDEIIAISAYVGSLKP